MKPDSSQVSLVLLGRFNPDDFHPKKLKDASVITIGDAEVVDYVVLIPGQTLQFKLSWCEFLVVPDRLQIVVYEAPYIRACDFVLKAINDMAPKSVVRAFGINKDAHYDLGSIKARNELGVKLAPPSRWGDWGKRIEDDIQNKLNKAENHGGVLSIHMRDVFTEGSIAGHLDVTVGPSNKIQNDRGVSFKFNHHHAIDTVQLPTSDSNIVLAEITTKLLSMISERFDASVNRADEIFEGVLRS